MKRITVQGGRGAPRVLVVDPRELDLARVARGLELGGAKVLALRRASGLIPVATAFRPNLLVVATRPPEFAALKLARRYHRDTRGAVPVLYLIDAPDPELRRYCLLRGQGMDVLSRPLDEVELLAKVERWLRHDEQVARAGREAFELRGPSLRDPLTGAFNRRWLLSSIAQETRRAERYGGGFSLLAARPTGFRELKRALGREVADQLLLHVRAVIGETVRESDAVARVGDEEFTVLLPQTPAEAVSPLRARLAQRFEQARLELGGRWHRPKVALGVMSFPDAVGAPARLIELAFRDSKRSDLGLIRPTV